MICYIICPAKHGSCVAVYWLITCKVEATTFHTEVLVIFWHNYGEFELELFSCPRKNSLTLNSWICCKLTNCNILERKYNFKVTWWQFQVFNFYSSFVANRKKWDFTGNPLLCAAFSVMCYHTCTPTLVMHIQGVSIKVLKNPGKFSSSAPYIFIHLNRYRLCLPSCTNLIALLCLLAGNVPLNTVCAINIFSN